MLQDKEHNLCRICRSANVKRTGVIRPYVDYEEFTVYDCTDCRCRFVWRKREVFEEMHASLDSPYSSHERIARKVKHLFDNNKISSLKGFLSKNRKFAFVINNTSPAGKKPKILELGCSLGYLTAYFICAGYDVLGADISETAVRKARSYFGNYFVRVDEDFYDKYANYFDHVYCLGTIGCVDDPILLISKVLSLLKPGGKLLLNVPNIRAAEALNEIWNNYTPPPDLITIFDETFWDTFKEIADVSISYEPYDHSINASNHLKRLLKHLHLDRSPKCFHERSCTVSKIKDKSNFRVLLRLLYKFLVKCFYYLSKGNLLHHYPLEFGMFVKLTRKEDANH